jgi:hypothetical protein
LTEKRKQHGWWSESKKLEAVTTYLAVGNSKMVEAITRIPAGTIRKWRTEGWWHELEGLLKEVTRPSHGPPGEWGHHLEPEDWRD